MSEYPGETSTLIFSQTSHILLKKLFCILVLPWEAKVTVRLSVQMSEQRDHICLMDYGVQRDIWDLVILPVGHVFHVFSMFSI